MEITLTSLGPEPCGDRAARESAWRTSCEHAIKVLEGTTVGVLLPLYEVVYTSGRPLGPPASRVGVIREEYRRTASGFVGERQRLRAHHLAYRGCRLSVADAVAAACLDLAAKSERLRAEMDGIGEIVRRLQDPEALPVVDMTTLLFPSGGIILD